MQESLYEKMKVLALVALVCVVLSCGQEIPSGGNKEDETVFTGNGYTYYYDKDTDKDMIGRVTSD
jgi:hypothetical protein